MKVSGSLPFHQNQSPFISWNGRQRTTTPAFLSCSSPSATRSSSLSHRRWLKELDRVAEGLEQLKKAGVVVLWRPFHEMNGDWFWWNGKDPDTFIKLWRQMFDYFTTTKQLDNLLWVYSPNHGKKTTDYYPGDRYVDIVGLDAYTDFVDPDHIKGY